MSLQSVSGLEAFDKSARVEIGAGGGVVTEPIIEIMRTEDSGHREALEQLLETRMPSQGVVRRIAAEEGHGDVCARISDSGR
jgi:hypothetical protein